MSYEATRAKVLQSYKSIFGGLKINEPPKIVYEGFQYIVMWIVYQLSYTRMGSSREIITTF